MQVCMIHPDVVLSLSSVITMATPLDSLQFPLWWLVFSRGWFVGGLVSVAAPCPALHLLILYLKGVFLTAPLTIVKVCFYLIIVTLMVTVTKTFSDVLLKPQSLHTLYAQVHQPLWQLSFWVQCLFLPFPRSRGLFSVPFLQIQWICTSDLWETVFVAPSLAIKAFIP